MSEPKFFPIMNSEIFRTIPWEVIANCESRAQRNHQQTLGQLRGRGGLTASEALAVLEDRDYWDRCEADLQLLRIVAAHIELKWKQ